MSSNGEVEPISQVLKTHFESGLPLFLKDELKENIREEEDGTPSSSSTAGSPSLFSGDVDRWIYGPSRHSTGVQNSRVMVQHSTLAAVPSSPPSYDSSGFWYILAMVLPLFSIPRCQHRRFDPSTILTTAELLLTHMGELCRQIRLHVQRLATDQLGRDLFAIVVDSVLMVYAVGFLILSVYQANLIG